MRLLDKLSYFGLVFPNLSSISALAKRRLRPTIVSRSGALTAAWHQSWPSDPTLLARWDTLMLTRPGATTFHSPAWQQAISRPYIRAGRFRLLTILDRADQMVATLPMQITSSGSLEAIGASISDYLDPLVHPDHADEIWAMCMESFGQVPGGDIDRIIFSNTRRDYLNLDALSSAAKSEKFQIDAQECALTARIPLQKTWEEYLATLDARDRKELRRKLRNAETKAGCRLVCASTESEVISALDHVFDCMKQAGGSKGIKAQWTYRPMFHRAAVPLVSSGRMKVYQLYLEGERAAGLISFPSMQGPQLWAAGYDQRFKQWSPGVVLFALAIQQAIAEGAPYFDLLRGQQRYKSELQASYSPLFQVTLTRRAA